MKKTSKWLAVVSMIIFVFAWGIMGLKFLDNNYLITAEAYIGLASLVVFSLCILYIKCKVRCPHCGKVKQTFGKYFPHCGKEVD